MDEPGDLLKTYITVESMFVAFCFLTGLIWLKITPQAFTRLFKSVDESAEDQHKMLLQDRLAFKKRIKETDAIIESRHSKTDSR